VFSGFESARMAEGFRDDLQTAEINRPELFERTKNRQRIRVHDLRATFVTLSLAAGRSEAWVQDRTGHRSSIMINRYRRAARTAQELELGCLEPLDALVSRRSKTPDVEPADPKTNDATLVRHIAKIPTAPWRKGRRGGLKIPCQQ
jgi:hypothetical protein